MLDLKRQRISLRLLSTMAAALLALLGLAACRPGAGPDNPPVGQHEGERHPMVGRTAPDFVGESPGGGWIRLRGLRGNPVLILIFRPRAPSSRELVEALGRQRRDPGMSSTGFVGIAMDSRENIERFGEVTGGALPTLRDPGSIARDYGVTEAATVLLIDAGGIVRFRLDGFAGPRFRPRLDATLEALRRLPTLGGLPPRQVHLEYTRHPRAPVFAAKDIDGTMVSLAALRGQVVVISIFDQESRPCLEDLSRLIPVIKEFRARGVRAIGVAERDVDGGMRRFMKEHGIDYPVIVDAGRDLLTRFDSGVTPDLFVIDAEGFIRFREQGARPDRAELTRLQIGIALGEESPADVTAELLERIKEPASFRSGVAHVGAEACRACHAEEFDQWRRTPHEAAYARLLRDGRGADPACTPCHTTGFGSRNGFGAATDAIPMTGVQCEVCHGPGGDHVAAPAALRKATIYGLTGDCPSCLVEGVCTTCHDAQNDPDFEITTALSKVTH